MTACVGAARTAGPPRRCPAQLLNPQPIGRPGGVHNHGYDDEKYDYIAVPGEEFGGRYEIHATIGTGSFSKVYRARDLRDGALVALKVVKSKAIFMAQAQAEVELLARLLQEDPEGVFNCTRLLDSFWHRGHQCLVFELLSCSLYEHLSEHEFEGLRLPVLRQMARQILKALAFLAHPDVDIIHADLKPENVLLRSRHGTSLQVIDFGSSCFGTRRMHTYIQSRFYRSPEIVLGIPYSRAIDMWSLGCMLVELHTGEPLFPATCAFDHICRMVGALGMPPEDLLARALPSSRAKFFAHGDCSSSSGSNGGGGKGGAERRLPPQFRPARGGSRLHGALLTTWVRERRRRAETAAFCTLAQTVGLEGGGPAHGRLPGQEGAAPCDAAARAQFYDLVSRMLDYRPECRLTPQQALAHPFMREPAAAAAAAAAALRSSRRLHQRASATAAAAAAAATPAVVAGCGGGGAGGDAMCCDAVTPLTPAPLLPLREQQQGSSALAPSRARRRQRNKGSGSSVLLARKAAASSSGGARLVKGRYCTRAAAAAAALRGVETRSSRRLSAGSIIGCGGASRCGRGARGRAGLAGAAARKHELQRRS